MMIYWRQREVWIHEGTSVTGYASEDVFIGPEDLP
jgi:hypothetical protein